MPSLDSHHRPEPDEKLGGEINGLDQTPLDAFMPSSPDTEDFRQSSSRFKSFASVDANSYRPPLHPTFLQSFPTDDISSSSIDPHHIADDDVLQPPASSAAGITPSPTSPSAPLSPSAGYLSETGLTEVTENSTPAFDDVLSSLRSALPSDLDASQDPRLTSASLGPVPFALPPVVSGKPEASPYLLSPVITESRGSPHHSTASEGAFHLDPDQGNPAHPAVNERVSLHHKMPRQQSPIIRLDPSGRPTAPLTALAGPALAEPSTRRDAEGAWLASRPNGVSGIAPDARASLNETEIPSLKEQEALRLLSEKNVEVEDWLGRSIEPTSAEQQWSSRPASTLRPPTVPSRRRARSAGDAQPPRLTLSTAALPGPEFDHSFIPGPGALIHEDSEDDLDEDAGSVRSSAGSASYAPAAEGEAFAERFPVAFIPTLNREPDTAPASGPRPWFDRPQPQDITFDQSQPGSSSAAMAQFIQASDKLETLSRVATWGTRRMSDSDIDKFLAGGSLEGLGIGADPSKGRGKPPGRNNFSIARLLPSAPAGLLRRKSADKNARPTPAGNEPSAGLAMPRSRSSFSRRPKSPILNTSSAMAAMAGQIAAVGGSSSLNAHASISPISPTTTPTTTSWRNPMKRSRSKTELARRKGADGARDAAPTGSAALEDGVSAGRSSPVATLSGPGPGPALAAEAAASSWVDGGDYGSGIRMPLGRSTPPTAPTLLGFQAHAGLLNPRCAPFLIDRIAHEQVRRFQKLMELRMKHMDAVNRRHCSSGEFCLALGGRAKQLPARAGQQGIEPPFAAFHVEEPGRAGDGAGLGDGAIAAAQFPDGVPLPPVSRLPAEFECQLCFQVKKFHKPSDWTKHVLEDVQPFTCTFPHCAEPKSFKRKADWVRHETERHRQLEWWKCSLPDCAHVCYRRDNFVQHLVREHKKPEEKLRAGKLAARTSAAGVRAGQAGRDSDLAGEAGADADDLWALVEGCRGETGKSARTEPCKFCGNVCNSWKKLTVHLARHMEQISLPVLDLVERPRPIGELFVTASEHAKMSRSAETSTSLTPATFSAGPSSDGLGGNFSPPLPQSGSTLAAHGPGFAAYEAGGTELSYDATTEGVASMGDAGSLAYEVSHGSYTSPRSMAGSNVGLSGLTAANSMASLSPHYGEGPLQTLVGLEAPTMATAALGGTGPTGYDGYQGESYVPTTSSMAHFGQTQAASTANVDFAASGINLYEYEAEGDEEGSGRRLDPSQPAAATEAASFAGVAATAKVQYPAPQYYRA